MGIYISTEARGLSATLYSLRAHTSQDVELLLLADGQDPATATTLACFQDLPQSATEKRVGTPACFNRLAASTDAEVLVLLESGARVAHGWLDYLLAALDADGRNGLAGPTTNRCWNEQGINAQGAGAGFEISRAAQDALRRFGPATRTLEPLYSLADFCYVVRREVVQEIGAADESYGLGPCWEMDYNIRAARAGWRGVWACAAYVHREPQTARRAREEARLFADSKRIYQDKFCGARLRGEKTGYRTHCRGDACPNFAPPALVQLSHALKHAPSHTLKPAPVLQPGASVTNEKHATLVNESAFINQSMIAPVQSSSPAFNQSPAVFTGERFSASEPLVSCIMPTANRRAFLPQALRCFLRQDYPNLELLIIDDGADSIADCVPAEDSRIRYLRLCGKQSVGAKRNYACAQARGEFIAHWDDDDWYPPWRVRVQLRAMLERDADLSGTSRLFFYEAGTDRAWRYEYKGSGKPWVCGSTMLYRKRLWERNKFPDIQIGEDTRFVWSPISKKVCDLADPALCVAAIHPANTSRKVTSGVFWHPQTSERVRELLGDELHAFGAGARAQASEALPLISCIMPTFNRRPFVSLALKYFLDQDYPNKELIVVDDGAERVGDLFEGLSNAHYTHLPRRTCIGSKRNLACRRARGEIIAHWDDDDWYAPDRLRYQAAPIINGEADLTGLVNTFVLELSDGNFWTTLPQLHAKMFVGDVHGGTLVYRKSLLAQGIRYPETNLAEDAALIRQALRRGKRLARLSNPGVFVYVRHGRNAWSEFAPGNFLDPDGWERVEPPTAFSQEIVSNYRNAASLINLPSEAPR
jgi:glycosyltransferase involved in cell wall biosynthesis